MTSNGQKANGDEPDANGFANGTNGYHKEEAWGLRTNAVP